MSPITARGSQNHHHKFPSSYIIIKRQKDRTLDVGDQYAIGDQWRNNSIKNEEKEPKQKQHPVVDVTGDRSKA